MRTQKRTLSALLVVILLFTAVPSTALAANPIGIMPLLDHMSSLSADLSISSGTASCSGRIVGQFGTTKITATVYLQRKPVNGTYSTVKTWSGLSSTTLTLTFSDTYPASSGYTYRLQLDATVTRNGTSESVTVYSAERTV